MSGQSVILIEDMRRNLYGFARQHGIHFDEKGECGFGRPCVGMGSSGHWIDYNPSTFPDYTPVAELYDERLAPGPEAPDAYHKHQCLVVLVHNGDIDHAVRQLHEWIKRLRSYGRLEIVEFQTGATGFQALFSGTTGRALVIR